MQATQFFDLTPEPQLFDLSPDTRSEGFASVLSASIDKQEAREKRISSTIAAHLGGEMTDIQLDFAHRMAAAAVEGPSAAAVSPESSHEPKGRRGRPRSRQPLMTSKTAGEKVLNSGATGESPPKSKTRSKAPPRSKSVYRAISMPPDPQTASTLKVVKNPEGSEFVSNELLAVEAAASSSGAKASSPPKEKTKSSSPPKEKTQATPPAKEKAPAKEDEPAPTKESKPAKASKGRAASMPPKKHGVLLTQDKPVSWWARQNIQFIKTQAELRGHRFSDLDTKGGMVKKDGKLMKSKRLSKADYLEVLTGLIAKGK